MKMKKIIDEEINIEYNSTIELEKIESLFRDFLTIIGEDINREGLKKTPYRVSKSWAFLLKGYSENLKDITNDAIFDAENSNMIVIKNIEFYSMCEHHLLPFFGVAHIAYIPDKKILGLSKFAKIVEMYSRRLQIQERLTNQIAMSIQEILNPQGVAVILDGYHLCMMMRGVEKQNSHTITSTLIGVFKNDHKTREEFLQIIKMKNEFIG
ncbi:MAG: GTP cyclohydrolase I FolE [Candidatus Calescibacterium sp.]|nr:GTP cyclohydrolase I FolE [Candidatus Calescibacterium sp.]MDW8133020.1 GTP cyclohydrolase I FolE [Candidatus Calescibacterium sp.]